MADPVVYTDLPGGLMIEDGPLPDYYTPPAWCETIIAEWKFRKRLADIGAHPTQMLLLQGPPGVGKTTGARYLARSMDLPTYSLLLAGAISSYLGETAKNLVNAIRWAGTNPCVIVVDEIDAVSWNRQTGGEGGGASGEMRRVVNALIQALDWWQQAPRASLLVGTTNMPDQMDEAIRGRFESEFEVPLPTHEELSRIAGVPIPETVEMSHRELRRLILQAKRTAVVCARDWKEELSSMIERDFSER